MPLACWAVFGFRAVNTCARGWMCPVAAVVRESWASWALLTMMLLIMLAVDGVDGVDGVASVTMKRAMNDAFNQTARIATTINSRFRQTTRP